MLPPDHPKRGKQGRPAKYDNRSIMNGMLRIAENGTLCTSGLFVGAEKESGESCWIF